jgi:hypothetical protein
VSNSGFNNDLNRVAKRSSVSLDSNILGIEFRVGFDIHGQIIHKAVFHKVLNHFRAAPVGVEFYKKSHRLEISAKFRQVRVKGGFPAGNDRSVKVFLPGSQKYLDMVYGKVPGVRAGNCQFRVVAVWAPEIAPGRKNYAADVRRIID